MNSEEADSEDDPNKLWCICQQPHNNRFMICCDSCLDWYHGKCVGITKKMGKEMEEAGNEWSCPKCKTKEEKENTAQLKDKMKERVQNRLENVESISYPAKKYCFFSLGRFLLRLLKPVSANKINSISRTKFVE